MSEANSDTDQLIGAMIKGDQGEYKIVRAIGAGGMGSVYEAEMVGSGRSVAIKFLHQELSGEDSSSKERFEREIRVLQDLKAFRGIVQIEDWGFHGDGRMFLVMEFVAAPTLDKVIDDNPNGLPQIKAVQIVTEILSVLEPIHHRRFVHRDLKPHNICVYQDPLAVRLLDFGLSKPYMEGHGYEKVTRRMQGKGSEIPGSPHYMSVEQFLRPKEVDLRTDLYAVGIILYELIAGIPPFRGIYLQDILRQHKENDPPRIENTVDGGPISYRLWDVIEKSLNKKPESRYQSAAEFKEALFDVLNMLNKRRRPRKDLDSKYRIIKKLGTGGNSEVFEAERRDDGERLALKIAREGASDWDEETLMNEADRALVHENIVRVFEFGSYEGRPALAMEIMEGGSLEDVLKERGDAGLEENLFYRSMIDVCRGLHHAHQKNIVHRDVKPGNMLRTLDGRTKVCDFGIAKRFETQGEEVQGAKNTTLAKGTAQYISPEQCDLQGRVDRRADIYSLGVMMYEMLAGKLPFTDGILIMQHLQTDPPPLEVKGDYKNPDALCAIVERAMKKSPDHRFQSMKELAQEIVRVSKLEPQKKAHKAVTLSTIPEEWKQEMARNAGMTDSATAMFEQAARRSNGLKLAIIAAVVLIAAVGGYVYVNRNQEQPSPQGVDARTAKLEELRSLVTGEKWADIRGFDFTDLEVGDGDRDLIGRKIDDEVVRLLSLGVANVTQADERLAGIQQVLGAFDSVTPAAPGTAPSLAFCAAAGKFVDAVRTMPQGWYEWDKSATDGLNAAIAGLPQDRQADLWKEFIAGQRADASRHNAAYLVTAIASIGDDWSGINEHLDRQLAEADAGRTAEILTAIRGWAKSKATAAEDMKGLTSFLADGGPAAQAAAQPDRKKLWDPRTGDLAQARSNRNRLETRSQAVVAGVLDALDDSAWVAKVSGWAALPTDPEQWAGNGRMGELASLPIPPFEGIAARALSSAILSPEFARVMSEKDSQLVDDGERNRFREACESGRSQVIAALKLDWTNFDPAAQQAWNEGLRSFSKDPAVLWETTYAHLLEKLKQGGDLPATYEGLEQLEGFLAIDGADEYRGKVQNGVIAILSRFGRPETAIARLGIATRFRAMMTGFESSIDAARTESAKQAGQLLVKPSYLQVDWRADPAVTSLNKAWLENKQDCIKLTLEPHPDLLFLRSKNFDIAGTNFRLTWGGKDAQEFIVQASPSAVVSRSAASAGAAKLAVDLLLDLAYGGDAPLRVAIALAGPTEFDVDPPQMGEISWMGPDQGKLEVAITVIDSNLPTDLKRIVAGPLDLARRAGAANDGPEAIFATTISLDDLQPVADLGDAVGVVEDSFGNKGEFKLSAADLKSRFTALATHIARLESQRVESLSVRSASAAEIRIVGQSLSAARLTFDKLKRTGLVDPSADVSATVKAAARLGVSWSRLQPRGTPSDDSAKARDELVAQIDTLAGVSGMNWADDRSSFAKAWEAASKPIASGNTDNPPPVVPVDPYVKKDVEALGVTWLRLDLRGQPPVWMASTEVSMKFVGDTARSFLNSRRFTMQSGSLLPIAPLSPKDAIDLVEQLNSSAAAELSQAFGGPVKFDIPTLAEWMAAAEKALGPNPRGYGSGDMDNQRYLKDSNRVDSTLSAYKNKWHQNLHEVNKEIGQKSGFFFLSGNVSEIVGKEGEWATKGGSFEDAHLKRKDENNRDLLFVDASQQTLKSRLDKGGNLTGLRLLIRPR